MHTWYFAGSGTCIFILSPVINFYKWYLFFNFFVAIRSDNIFYIGCKRNQQRRKISKGKRSFTIVSAFFVTSFRTLLTSYLYSSSLLKDIIELFFIIYDDEHQYHFLPFIIDGKRRMTKLCGTN